MFKTTKLAWLILTAICATAQQPPLPPSQDPFYSAPTEYENTAPGTILRIRPAPASPGFNIIATTANCSSVHNIVYRTTNSRYEPSWAVTTLFSPSAPSNRSGRGSVLLSYQIPYNSVDVNNSPSYALYNASARPSDIAAALGKGWYVSVPDFEGPAASFALGVQEGHATLDSIRAVLRSGTGLLGSGTRCAMWGYSGGSIASEWASELAVQYAPELEFAGMAIGGVVTNATGTLEVITGTRWAVLIPSALLGLTSQYPAARKFLLNELKTSGPYNKTGFLSAYHMSADQNFAAFAGQNVFAYFKGGSATYMAPLIQAIVNSDGVMGYHGVPQMPVFVYKAIQDELCPIEATDELVTRYCDIGANILYHRNEIGGHLAEYTNGVGRAFEWLSGVLEGTSGLRSPVLGCSVENVAVNVTDSPL